MAKSTGRMGVSNQLLGRVLRKHPHSNSMMWPTDWEPNVSGEHLGIIEAVWLDSHKDLLALIVNPMNGQVAQVYVNHHLLSPKKE